MKLAIFLLAASAAFAQAPTRPVELTWSASATPGVTGYNVYRATAPTGPFAALNTTPVTTPTYNDSGAQVGMTYTYYVTAVAPSCSASLPAATACGESVPSQSVTVPVGPRPNSPTSIVIIVN